MGLIPIPELELLILKNGLGIDIIRIEGCYKEKLNPKINLPLNFLIQKYFFHDNPTWNINYSE